jgi:hypothetical protein
VRGREKREERMRVLDGGRGKNGNDVSEIAGPGYLSPGPDPPETRQTAFAPCPLASRLSPTPPLLSPTRCLRAPLPPSECSSRRTSAPSDSRLYLC